MSAARRRVPFTAVRPAMAVALLALLALLAGAPPSEAAAPPNRNDPCSEGGRNICDTNGVGRYETYRYGIRWFGDFRGAVPEVDLPTFCIDLRFWYPRPASRFAPLRAAGLRNRDGRVVPVINQRKMSYALWTYGRSDNPGRQAAVMLYVHEMMGDGRPGEVDPSVLGPAVVRQFNRIDREATRLHGPYSLRVRMPRRAVAGAPAAAIVRLATSRGTPVRNAVISLDADNARVPARVRTNARGLARVRFVPSGAGRVLIRATADELAADLPDYFRPTTAAARRNGQRLAAPASQSVTAAGAVDARKATIRVSTTALPDVLLLGEGSRDEIRLIGVPEGRGIEVTSLLYGPFRSREAIVCTGEPVARASVSVDSSGTVESPAYVPASVGFYTYRVEIAGDQDLNPVSTACGIPAETFVVETQPGVVTQVSQQSTAPGAQIFDSVNVSGLAGETADVDVRLYGPFPTREAMACDGEPYWAGRITATGDGVYQTAPVTLDTAGYYTYTESIGTQGFVRAQQSACGLATETTVARGTPVVSTRISDQRTEPGDRVTDLVDISGLGALRATVTAELWGPYPTREAMDCEGSPQWTGSFAAEGDGRTTTAPVRLPAAGYYTYRMTIEGTEAFDPVVTPCGEPAETTETTASPTVTTLASREVLKPGGALFDRLRVRGLGRTPATVEVQLFGPFSSRAAIRCDTSPVWEGTVRVPGDGTYRTRPVRVERVGIYSYRERLVEDGLVGGFQGECGLVAETALAAPVINTGRADERLGSPGVQRATQADPGDRPVRVRSPQLGIDTRVLPATINLARGELAVPVDIRRAGWWRDGASPGDRTGATLIAGHVDSARRGPGAFFALTRRARPGQRVQVTSADRRTRTYRIVSVRRVLKDRLPDNIYSLRGRERLVLVTCGGPFDRASGSYLDNVVVTAVPV
ncbi:MAG: class F sortase [Miltoncostaeaceae bacterium]